jgi:hypothetical protein
MGLKTSDYVTNMPYRQPQARLHNGLAVELEYEELRD